MAWGLKGHLPLTMREFCIRDSGRWHGAPGHLLLALGEFFVPT